VGWVLAHGYCYACGAVFGFNPHSVPSLTSPGGSREPICEACIEALNAKRRRAGLSPHSVLADAYEPIPEQEL